MKKKIIDRIQIYMTNLILFVIFWGGLLRHNYNADTIFHMVVDDADIMTNVEAGRYVIALGDLILFRLGFRTTSNISITMLITFLLFAVAMTRVSRLFAQWSPKVGWAKMGYFIGVQLIFLNVLFVELLMFNEYCIYFAFGYCMAVISVEMFTKHEYALMIICLFTATATYQYTAVFAAILIAFYVCMEYQQELSWKAVKTEISGIMISMGIGGINYLSVILLLKLGIIKEFGKTAGVGEFGEKIEDALVSLKNLYQSSAGIFPDLWIPLLFTLAIWGIIVIECFRKNELNKLIFIFVVWLGSHLLLYVIPFMQQELSFPPRMSFCVYLIQVGLILIAYTISREEMKNILTLMSIGYLVVQLLFSQFIVSNRFVSNTLDEVYVNMAYQKILEYEEETGITVTRLAVADDTYAPDYYKGVNYTSGQINERCLGTVTNSLVWVCTGREFERTHMDEDIYQKYFEGKDWDYLNLSEQFIIIDDTAYWCIF